MVQIIPGGGVPSHVAINASGITIPIQSAVTELLTPRFRASVDLSRATEMRLTVGVSAAGAADGRMRIQWAPFGTTTWGEIPSEGELAVPTDAVGHQDSEWVTIDPDARQEVILRAAVSDGGGTNATLGRIDVSVR